MGYVGRMQTIGRGITSCLIVILGAVPQPGPLLGVVRVDDEGSLPNSQVNQLPCALPQLLLILIKWTSYTMVRGVKMLPCHRVNWKQHSSRVWEMQEHALVSRHMTAGLDNVDAR